MNKKAAVIKVRWELCQLVVKQPQMPYFLWVILFLMISILWQVAIQHKHLFYDT